MKIKNNILTKVGSSNITYPEFDYNVSQLSKYAASSDLFSILLKNGEIIHYTAADKYAFRKWLSEHNIENIKI